MKKIFLFLIVIIVFTSGCEKYTLNKIYGPYTLTTYTVDGVDSLSLYNDSLGLNFDFYYNDVNSSNVCFIDGNRSDNKYTHIVCVWELLDNNSKLKIITAYGFIGTGPFGRDKIPLWEIIKLENNYLKMKTYFNNKEYQISLIAS